MDAPDAGGLVTIALALLLWAQAEVRAWYTARQLRASDRRAERLALTAGEVARLVGDYTADAGRRLNETDHPAFRRAGAALDAFFAEVHHGGDGH